MKIALADVREQLLKEVSGMRGKHLMVCVRQKGSWRCVTIACHGSGSRAIAERPLLSRLEAGYGVATAAWNRTAETAVAQLLSIFANFRGAFTVPVMTVAVLAGLCGMTAAADSSNSGIAVAGTGESKGKPTVVELSGTVTGEAELASDAITKYRDNRQRAVEAMENLKIEGLKVEGSGVSINSALSPQAMQQMMNGMGASGTGNARLQVSEPLTIRIQGIDKMSTEDLLGMLVRIVDAGKDAGIAIGPAFEYNPYVYNPRAGQPAGLAKFRMADVKELRTAAYAAAIKDAREQAERLAMLSGVKLGRVTSVREGAPQSTNVNVVYYAVPSSSNEADKYTTNKLEDITVKIVLQVEFAIE